MVKALTRLGIRAVSYLVIVLIGYWVIGLSERSGDPESVSDSGLC